MNKEEEIKKVLSFLDKIYTDLNSLTIGPNGEKKFRTILEKMILIERNLTPLMMESFELERKYRDVAFKIQELAAKFDMISSTGFIDEVEEKNDDFYYNNYLMEDDDDYIEEEEKIEPEIISFDEYLQRMSPVIGLDNVKEDLYVETVFRLEHNDLFENRLMKKGKGILLVGKPGVGKTFIMKTFSEVMNFHFIKVSISDILNKFVGETEQNLKRVFDYARQNAPSIIYFEEIDALSTRRGNTPDSPWNDQMVSEFLSQLDGMNDNHGVIVVGSTNFIEKIDNAFLERFSTIINVPLPSYEARRQMFSNFLEDVPLKKNLNYEQLAKTSDGYSGRKIENLCREVVKSHYKKIAKKEMEIADIIIRTSDFYTGDLKRKLLEKEKEEENNTSDEEET